MPIRKFFARLYDVNIEEIVRASVTLSSGAILGRVISILSMPLITRLYDPEDFGIFSVCLSLVMIISPFLTFKYILAIPLPSNDGSALNLLAIASLLLLVMTSIASISMVLFKEEIFYTFSIEYLIDWWWLIIIGSVSTSAYEALKLWATRKRSYKLMARSHFEQSIVAAIIKVVLGLMVILPFGLLFAHIFSQLLATIRMIHGSWNGIRVQLNKLRFKRMIIVANYYRSFPIWRLTSQLLLVISTQAPLLFFASIYDVEITGQFGLANSVMAIPVAVVGQSLASALYGESANSLRSQDANIYQIALSLQKRLLILSFFPTLVIIIFGEILFSYIFGIEWQQAGLFASILACATALQFTSTPLISLMSIMRKQAPFFYLNFLRVVMIVLLFVNAQIFELSPKDTVIGYSVLLTVFYCFATVLILRSLKVQFRE